MAVSVVGQRLVSKRKGLQTGMAVGSGLACHLHVGTQAEHFVASAATGQGSDRVAKKNRPVRNRPI